MGGKRQRYEKEIYKGMKEEVFVYSIKGYVNSEAMNQDPTCNNSFDHMFPF